jgi:hypothetical protein
MFSQVITKDLEVQYSPKQLVCSQIAHNIAEPGLRGEPIRLILTGCRENTIVQPEKD